ncbi:hypothetical protein NGB36_18140 [Streptomyces sp. RB6PN25]|uniref:Uncharacterized protein n=1 Tax=Streptomyces humicola TaxID=2953240 RepID=A0ABT1PXS5_9ACTN|nr:hypothetical protein [Streptomyces humicola]MCQ4082469.1 hypothetical protein [Streptomyces humicola]
MASKPQVHFAVIDPPTPSWWRRNRHIVLLILGLIIGHQWGIGHASAHTPPAPKPSHAPATPGRSTVTPLPTHVCTPRKAA